MMAEGRYLAFDLGAESGRAVVGTLEQGCMTMVEIYRFETGILEVAGNSYCSALQCCKEVIKALQIYVQKYGPTVDSIGVDSWGCDFALLDKQGRLLGVPYSYRDSQVAGTLEIIQEKMGKDRLYELTGIQMLTINTLNQLIGMGRKEDPLLPVCQNMLFIGDFIHYFLTGNIATEYTMLSISQLYNPEKREYEEEVFQTFGIPEEIKTPIIYPGDIYGIVKEEIHLESGIDAKTKVVTPAVHDTASAICAVGALPDEKWLVLSSGTWSILGIELDELLINEESCEYSFSNSGGVGGKNLLLKNVMGLWIVQSCKREWNKKDPRLSYDQMVKLAMEAKEHTVYIDPDDDLFFNPESMSKAINGFLKKSGQPQIDETDIGLMTRVIYESLAMKYRYVIERIEKAAGVKGDTLYVIGGGSKNQLLNQFTANVTGKEVLAGSSEASTLGNLLTQAHGCGKLKTLEDMRGLARNSGSYKVFSPEQAGKWEEEYQQFLETVQILPAV